MFYNNIINPFIGSLQNYAEKDAFCIHGKFYKYVQLGEKVSRIRHFFQGDDKIIGLVINDDLETYASIFALWLEGKCYVPLHPKWPLERCLDICEQVGMKTILDSSETTRYESFNVIDTTNLQNEGCLFEPKLNVPDDELAYILFTSGSTGKPKGVQLSRKNLASFVDAFFNIYSVDENDKCLQCFDLSFDLSIMSYLIPLLKGACVYTVPTDSIKYNYTADLIEEQQLTFALMAPSTIRYLKPYFDELDCSSLRYSLFCGEALHLDITKEWSECAKNAIIDNVYGPTEDTIFCSTYRYNRGNANKAHNGVLSIGKPMKNCDMAIFDENNSECPIGTIGELCLSGHQLTMGYHNNISKNKESFFIKDGIRWYHSGDLCYKDADGDFMYIGRLDHQVKINGFRVELGEVEFHAKAFLEDKNVICLAYDAKDNHTEIALFVESAPFDHKSLESYMRTKIPAYMIPSQYVFVPTLPLNENGKIDRKELKKSINNS